MNTIVKLSGHIDGANSHTVEALIDEKRSTGIKTGTKDLVIDMAEVGFLSSVGVRAILRIFSRIQKEGGTLKVVNPSRLVLDTLRLVWFFDEIVDMDTVATPEPPTPCAYPDAYEQSITPKQVEVAAASHAFCVAFGDAIGLSSPIVNGLNLGIVEFALISSTNNHSGTEKDITLTLQYFPDQQEVCLIATIHDQPIMMPKGNPRDAAQKSIGFDADNEDAVVGLAQMNAARFWTRVQPAQVGGDAVIKMFKKLC